MTWHPEGIVSDWVSEGGKGLHIEMLSMQKKNKRLRTIDIENNA